jgi:acyl dehydratase
MQLDGPYFDDFRVGETLPPAPAITIGDGEAALYQSIVGDPYALALSRPLARTVTGDARPIVNPALALHFSIGQSTVATRRVVANLFYRGVILVRPVRLGETLSTTVEIRGLRETSRRPDRPPRGMALLGIRTVSDEGDVVADYERCALVPLRDPAPTGHADDLGDATRPFDFADYAPYAPIEWDLQPLGEPGEWQPGEHRADPMRDTVTDAPALVRLTQNQAAVHRDARLGQGGRRLVYGGHTIGLAQASLTRLLP